ncbi:fimbrial protein StkG [Enterobacter cloacae]|uniref:fimbrial protein StkG n=1 Tax=Enterobacter cloacae TaxID=550 RepID=UPI0020059FC6|nr:fimbrial protein StkG [Enterobacter cloacae]MCK7417061.1 fimbrial protein StkG [Enterobacter cloacae]MCK7438563.1 fimbrial protein StkG [Enterobacter cloacae]
MAQRPGITVSPRFYGFIILFMLLTMSAFYASAAEECQIGSAKPRAVGDFTGGKPTLRAVDAVTAPTKISTLYPLSLTPRLMSVCSGGQHGENIFTATRATLQVGSIDGKALFKTNVTGIAYALAFRTIGTGVTAYFAPSTNWFLTLHLEDQDELLQYRTWEAAVEFYQLPSFAGVPAEVVSVGPAGGTIGDFGIGDPYAPNDDHPGTTISIADMAFTTPIIKPTCTLTAPKNVDLGDYGVSDLENDNTLNVYAAVSGNCTNTRKITMKLTTSKTTGTDGTLLANTASSNAAKGVGVLLKWPDNSQVVPNSTNSYSASENTTIALFSRLLTARLVKSDTEKVTSGTFSAIGTLQFTYE